MPDISTNENVALYERIREAVLEEATCPLNGDVEQHRANIRRQLENVDNLGILFDPNLSAEDFWQVCWQKIRYANMEANKASAEIERLTAHGVFGEFEGFAEADWNVPDQPGKTLIKNEQWGAQAQNLLLKQEQFEGLKWNAFRPKLAKIVNIARKINSFVQTNPRRPILELFLGEDFEDEDDRFWAAHGRLGEIVGNITALHIMMDIGMRCVKPDIVLTRAFYLLGWLPDDIIPPDIGRDDLEILLREGRARCKYEGTRPARKISKKYPEHIFSAGLYEYTNKRVYKSVVAAGRSLSRIITPIFKNSIRELDWFIVKYGQEPEPKRGIVRRLDKGYPIEKFLSCMAKVNNNPNTPLHYAAMHGKNLEAIQQHIRDGADVNARNMHGQIPWDVARQEGCREEKRHQESQRRREDQYQRDAQRRQEVQRLLQEVMQK